MRRDNWPFTLLHSIASVKQSFTPTPNTPRMHESAIRRRRPSIRHAQGVAYYTMLWWSRLTWYCWTSSRTSRRSMRSRRSESAGALIPGATALWLMVDLKLAEAGIWTHNLYSRLSAEVFKLVFLCGLAVA